MAEDLVAVASVEVEAASVALAVEVAVVAELAGPGNLLNNAKGK